MSYHCYSKRGLHPYFKLRAHHKPHPYLHRGHPSQPPAPPPGSWTPPQICDRYGLPDGLSGDGVIGIYEAGGGWVASDVAANFALYGLPAPTIVDVSVDGTVNNGNPTDPASGEVMLDIVGAAGNFAKLTGKPAKIRVYWSQKFSDAISAAAKDGCRVLSFSWGASQSVWATGGLGESLEDVDAAAAGALEVGMVCTAASGDNSADDGGGATAVDGPACCEHFIGCGGTHLTATTETVWNNDPGNPSGEGTGGGYADNSNGDFPMPAWQAGVVPKPPQATMGRMVPDVAWVADPDTGCALILDGHLTVVGGTSFAAPSWAGLIAAASSGPLANLLPVFYANPTAFNVDIAGDNGVYTQPPCPGPCCGMGSPKAGIVALIAGATIASHPTTHVADPTLAVGRRRRRA